MKAAHPTPGSETGQQLSIPGLDGRLKAQIKESELSGAEVARRAGIKPKTFNNYINGTREPDIGTLQKICGAIGISVEELIGRQWELLRHRDRLTHRAMVQLEAACNELDGNDVRFVANLAAFMSQRRHEEEREHAGHLSPAFRQLSRAHERLIPAILRTLSPTFLDTYTLGDGANHLCLTIVMRYGGTRKDVALDRINAALMELARDVLKLPEDRMCLLPSEPPNVNFEIQLGRISVPT